MKKRKLRTILMMILITVFTTTSVFAINTANFKPYHNSQPITGAGKQNYISKGGDEGGYFSRWDSKTSSIIPMTATTGKPGISAHFTDQAKRDSGAYSARTKGAAFGLSYYGLSQTSPIEVLKTDKWYNFLTDKNSGNNVQVHYYHNKIYDPTDKNFADENGYVHFTTRTTVRAWTFNNNPKKRIRASQDGKVYASKKKMQDNVPLRGSISLSNKASGGIPSVVVVGIDSADVIHEFFYETKSGSNWVTTGQRYNFHGTFTYGDIDSQQAISVSTGNLRGSTVLTTTNLRFKVDSGYAVYAAKTGARSAVKEDTVALSVEGQTLYFVYSTASKSKTKSGVYYPDGGYSYYGTTAGGTAEPGVSEPIKRVSDTTKYQNVAETNVKENHL